MWMGVDVIGWGVYGLWWGYDGRMFCFLFCFFFSSRRRHTRSLRDWSSDVCSSDLAFEAAERGTLFLDEIGELPLAAQAKLLRVLEERRVTRVGGTRSLPVEARVVRSEERRVGKECRSRWSSSH